jgi:hypothetical protein
MSPGIQRRKETRIQTSLPICVTGINTEGQCFKQDAVATDISIGGALVTGVQQQMRCGDAIRITFNGIEARFRIVWLSEAGPYNYKIAVHKFDPDDCPWTESLTARESKSEPAEPTGNSLIFNEKTAALSNRVEKPGIEKPYRQTRRWRRRKLDVPIRVIIRRSDKTSLFDGRGNELSEGGMALTAGVELLPGDTIDIEFTPPYSGLPIRHTGVVRNRTGYRYGIEFLTNSSKDAEQTERLLTMLTSM